MLTILRNIFLFLFFLAINAHAQDCFAPSPTTQDNGSMSSEIKSREISKSEYQELTSFFKYLNRDWAGIGKEVLCKGRKEEPYKEINDYNISAETTMNYQGKFTFKFNLYDSIKRTTSYKNYDLFLTEKFLRADSDSGAGDIELIEISENTIRYRQRSIHGGMRGVPRQEEVFTTIQRTPNGFKLIKIFYHQGLFSGENRWHLVKGR